MKRMTTTFISAMMALTFIAASAATPAQAGSKERRIVAGILLGAIGGAIIANEINRSKKKKQRHYNQRHNPSHVYNEDIYVDRRHQRRVRHNPRISEWEHHVRRCQRAYRSYDEFSDTWIDRRGRERLCRL